MRKSHVVSVLAISITVLTGCSTAELTSSGARVQFVTQMDRKDCKNLGPVFGKGGGQFGGGFISDEQLMEYAANDLRNKAALKGATHVVTTTHQMGTSGGRYGGTTTTATNQGVAYYCP